MHVMSTTVVTTLVNFSTAELEDPQESSKPISAVNDSPAGSSMKTGEDILGSA